MKQIICISVIIPVYNVEKYLEQCVNSVISQKYSDYEIILVDDGSTDRSGELCDKLAYQNNNIKVLHKLNEGLSDARNKGLELASGKYVIFLDSDDYWSDDTFLQKVQSEINNNDPDLIVFGFSKMFADGKKYKYIPQKKGDTVSAMLQNGIFNICAWDKVIKTSLLTEHRIIFRENVFSEDMEWCAKLFKFADSGSVISEAPYVYRQRSDSITKNISGKNITDVMNNYNRCLELQREMDDEKKEKFNLYLSRNLSMFIISLSQLEIKEQKNFYPFIKQNLNILKYCTRNREKYLYISIRLSGIKRTEKILKTIYSCKLKGHDEKNN